MWYESESIIKPLEVDDLSSKVYVYVRNDIKEVVDDEKGTYYTYREQKVKKDDWELYKKVSNHSTELAEVEDALMELAELMIGGN